MFAHEPLPRLVYVGSSSGGLTVVEAARQFEITAAGCGCGVAGCPHLAPLAPGFSGRAVALRTAAAVASAWLSYWGARGQPAEWVNARTAGRSTAGVVALVAGGYPAVSLAVHLQPVRLGRDLEYVTVWTRRVPEELFPGEVSAARVRFGG